MEMYYADKCEVARAEIEAAWNTGKARLVMGYNPDGGLTTSLSLTGKDWDTRYDGSCHMMSEQTWTMRPESLDECLRTASFCLSD